MDEDKKARRAFRRRHQSTLDDLVAAVNAGQLNLMICQDRKTGEPVAVLVACKVIDGEFEFAPLARFFNGPPADEVTPPDLMAMVAEST